MGSLAGPKLLRGAENGRPPSSNRATQLYRESRTAQLHGQRGQAAGAPRAGDYDGLRAVRVGDDGAAHAPSLARQRDMGQSRLGPGADGREAL